VGVHTELIVPTCKPTRRQRMRTVRKTIITVIMLTIIVASLVFLGQRLFARPEKETGPVGLGDISELELQPITGEGMIVPTQWAELGFQTSGQLAELVIKLGDAVASGQVLARLEASELELQLELAQSVLELKQAELARLQEAPCETEIAAAQASYEAAVANYQKLKAGPSSEGFAVAEADLAKAAIALERAQAAYDAASRRPDIGQRPEPLRLDLARIDYRQAKAAYELAIGEPDKAALKQAESQVAAAKAQLEVLRENAQGGAIQTAQADVIRARMDLAAAERELEQAVLRAPFAGTITSVADVRSGDMIQPGHPILTLADLTHLQIECKDLNEWGTANVKLNQIVDMMVPAQGGRSLRGRLASVSAEPTAHSGDSALYEATVALDAQDPDLRWGTKVRITFGQPDPYTILAAMSE